MNENLRLVKNLLEKRSARQKEQCFVVEGPRLVAEAKTKIKFVIYAEDLPIITSLRQAGISCFKVAKKAFKELSCVDTPQWILAVVAMKQNNWEELFISPNPLVIVCHQIQDPGNLGTIIRTADAIAAAGVVLTKGTVDLYNPKVVRATAGALFHLPFIVDVQVEIAFEQLKKAGLSLIAADLSVQQSCFDLDLTKSLALIVGNEGSGLGREVLKCCDRVVKIPMPGKAESLNVSVSTAVLLYEALRQRNYARKN